jgi:hypothetical protein
MGDIVTDDGRTLLRHTLATLAYRGGKAIRGAPNGFSEFRVAETSRTSGQILAHIGDLLDWGLSLAEGAQRWLDSTPQSWEADSKRFFAALQKFDDRLADPAQLACPVEKLFQGPVADSLTHVGQIAMLRRLAGAPIKGENYHRADIEVGRVGQDQTAPKREF